MISAGIVDLRAVVRVTPESRDRSFWKRKGIHPERTAGDCPGHRPSGPLAFPQKPRDASCCPAGTRAIAGPAGVSWSHALDLNLLTLRPGSSGRNGQLPTVPAVVYGGTHAHHRSGGPFPHLRLRGYLAGRAGALRAEVDAAIRDAYAAAYAERVVDGISGHYLPWRPG
jgi:hypothetical protein